MSEGDNEYFFLLKRMTGYWDSKCEVSKRI